MGVPRIAVIAGAAALAAACSAAPSAGPAPTSSAPAPTSAGPGVGMGAPSASAAALAPAQCDAKPSKDAVFYRVPSPLPAKDPGSVIKCEPDPAVTKNMTAQGGTSATVYRIMYITEAPAPAAGTPAYQPGSTALVRRASTGLVFVPTAAAPAGGRKVVAWDHGTVGMGEQCAPSRSGYGDMTPVTPGSKPTQHVGFISNMVAANWLVVATDYAGLGTDGSTGTLQYLVGASEAMDTANAVRAATTMPGAGVTTPDYAVYGQSQGGHATLFTGTIGPRYAPELRLRAVVASDPAAEMVSLVKAQWDKRIAWVLGPEVVISWPAVNTTLKKPAPAADVLAKDQVVTQEGRLHYEGLAGKCTMDAAAWSFINSQSFFTERIIDPSDAAGSLWLKMAAAQSPPVVTDVPVLVGQSTNDGVVVPESQVVLQEAWCPVNPALRMLWVQNPDAGTGFIAGVEAHLHSAWQDALPAIDFIGKAFDGGDVTTVAGTTPCSQAHPPFPTASAS